MRNQYQQDRERERQLAVARQEQVAARREHEQRVDEATARVAAAKAQLEALRQPAPLASLTLSPQIQRLREKKRSLVVYPDRLETPDGVRTLSKKMSATVDTAGNIYVKGRTTPGRVVGGALIGGGVGLMVGVGAKKDEVFDSRELYLLIEDEDWGIVERCPPDQGAAARRFAQQLNIATRNLLTDTERDQQVAKALKELGDAETAVQQLRPVASGADNARGRTPTVGEQRSFAMKMAWSLLADGRTKLALDQAFSALSGNADPHVLSDLVAFAAAAKDKAKGRDGMRAEALARRVEQASATGPAEVAPQASERD